MNQLLQGLHVPAFVAGALAVGVSLADRWQFHASFGADIDQKLLIAGLATIAGGGVYLAGLIAPSPTARP